MDLPALVASAKRIAAFPRDGWSERDATGVTWSAPLDVNGVTVEGLTLRFRAVKFMPEAAVYIALIHKPIRSSHVGGAIARIDWRPTHSHNNKGVGPSELQYCQQECSHHHRFDLNWDNSPGMVRRGGLPIAVPLTPDPSDFNSLLETVANEFMIEDARRVPEPNWQTKLL